MINAEELLFVVDKQNIPTEIYLSAVGGTRTLTTD